MDEAIIRNSSLVMLFSGYLGLCLRGGKWNLREGGQDRCKRG